MRLFGPVTGNREVWYSIVLNMALVILPFFSSVFAGLYRGNQQLPSYRIPWSAQRRCCGKSNRLGVSSTKRSETASKR